MPKLSASRSRKEGILQLCKTPMRFTDLKEEVQITDRGLAKHLTPFRWKVCCGNERRTACMNSHQLDEPG
jgi:hypothetical protein